MVRQLIRDSFLLNLGADASARLLVVSSIAMAARERETASYEHNLHISLSDMLLIGRTST